MNSTGNQYPKIYYDPDAEALKLAPYGGMQCLLTSNDLSRLQREIAAGRAQQISAEARRERTGISRLKQGVMRLVGGGV